MLKTKTLKCARVEFSGCCVRAPALMKVVLMKLTTFILILMNLNLVPLSSASVVRLCRPPLFSVRGGAGAHPPLDPIIFNRWSPGVLSWAPGQLCNIQHARHKTLRHLLFCVCVVVPSSITNRSVAAAAGSRMMRVSPCPSCRGTANPWLESAFISHVGCVSHHRLVCSAESRHCLTWGHPFFFFPFLFFFLFLHSPFSCLLSSVISIKIWLLLGPLPPAHPFDLSTTLHPEHPRRLSFRWSPPAVP